MGAQSERERGQILVLFALGLVAMLTMASLVVDAGRAVVVRRQLQNVSDAAALAAANVVQSGTTRGCSLTPGSPPGAPRSDVVAAARASVAANMPGFPTANIFVSCPDGWLNYAVEVDLRATSDVTFGAVVGLHGIDIGTTSQAVNGQTGSLRFSVVELDPYHPSWPNGYQGCPSVLLSGGPTVIFDGSMQIDSACPAGSGGALGTNGNAASLTFNNGAGISIVGGYAPGPLTISPAPKTGQRVVRDPLSGLPAVPVSALPNRSHNQVVLNSGTTVLDPGVYVGGIQMKNQAVALLRPGIYVIQGGGFQVGAGNAVYSVAPGISSTSAATWKTADCLASNCGVLIFFTGFTNRTNTQEQISVTAGATLKLRPYLAAADPNAGALTDASAYANLLLWQDVNSVPTSGNPQPIVQLNGGGTVDVSGTVYAPSAAVQMGGGSGGSGGASTDLTLQFISWDLTLQGNSSFHFYYQSQAFAKPTDYGLIK